MKKPKTDVRTQIALDLFEAIGAIRNHRQLSVADKNAMSLELIKRAFAKAIMADPKTPVNIRNQASVTAYTATNNIVYFFEKRFETDYSPKTLLNKILGQGKWKSMLYNSSYKL